MFMMVTSLNALEDLWVIFSSVHSIIWADSVWITIESISRLMGSVVSSLNVNAIINCIWIDFIWVSNRCMSFCSLIWTSETISCIGSPFITIKRISVLNLSMSWSLSIHKVRRLIFLLCCGSRVLHILTMSPVWVAIPIWCILSKIWIIFGAWLSSYLSSSLEGGNLIWTSNRIIFRDGIWIQIERISRSEMTSSVMATTSFVLGQNVSDNLVLLMMMMSSIDSSNKGKDCDRCVFHFYNLLYIPNNLTI